MLSTTRIYKNILQNQLKKKELEQPFARLYRLDASIATSKSAPKSALSKAASTLGALAAHSEHLQAGDPEGISSIKEHVLLNFALML